MPVNRRIVLAKRPVGEPDESCFRLETTALPTPNEGELLLRTLYVSVDPYMRGRMNDARSYAKPVELGEVMVAGSLSEVLESRAEGYAKGELVVGYGGWQDYAIARGTSGRLTKVDRSLAPLPAWLGVLGMPGHTAYFGLLELGKPKAGETVVVSAAAGAVGSVVGQIAKLEGCRAVGIAGGPDKCALVVRDFGFDACVDYKSKTFAADLAAACPKGVDVYFENVGGPVLDAVAPLLNDGARVPICGMISAYNATSAVKTPFEVLAAHPKKPAHQFFVVSQWNAQVPAAIAQLGAWLKAGKLRHRETIVEGLESAPKAFKGLFSGQNVGKMVVHVADPSAGQ